LIPPNPRLAALERAFATPVSGPSYRPVTRGLAVLVVGGLLAWGARAIVLSDEVLGAQQWAAAAVVALALLWPLPALLFNRTVLDAAGIRQAGWMGREAAWTQVQRARFLRFPMSPRLMLSVGFGRARVFYSGNAELDLAFDRASTLLTGPTWAVDPDTSPGPGATAAAPSPSPSPSAPPPASGSGLDARGARR
jgi:hypothetical protein